MTKNKAALCQPHSGKGLPSRLSPFQYSRLEGNLQDHHQNAGHLNHFSTALEHSAMLEVAWHAGKGIVTETQPVGKGQMSQNRLEVAEQFCLHAWRAFVFLVFTRVIVRVERTPYAAMDESVLVWLESGVWV